MTHKISILFFICLLLLTGVTVNKANSEPQGLSKIEKQLEEWADLQHVQIVLNEVELLLVYPNAGGWDAARWNPVDSKALTHFRTCLAQSSCTEEKLMAALELVAKSSQLRAPQLPEGLSKTAVLSMQETKKALACLGHVEFRSLSFSSD